MIMCLMLHAVKDVGIAPADVRTHVIFYALYSYILLAAPREGRVYGDPCYMYNYFTFDNNRSDDGK